MCVLRPRVVNRTDAHGCAPTAPPPLLLLRIRDVEQASAASGLQGSKAIDQLKFKEAEVKRYE